VSSLDGSWRFSAYSHPIPEGDGTFTGKAEQLAHSLQVEYSCCAVFQEQSFDHF